MTTDERNALQMIFKQPISEMATFRPAEVVIHSGSEVQTVVPFTEQPEIDVPVYRKQSTPTRINTMPKKRRKSRKITIRCPECGKKFPSSHAFAGHAIWHKRWKKEAEVKANGTQTYNAQNLGTSDEQKTRNIACVQWIREALASKLWDDYKKAGSVESFHPKFYAAFEAFTTIEQLIGGAQ